MTARPASSLTLEEAKQACKHLIDVIYEFVDSIDKAFPSANYNVLATHLISMKDNIQNASGPFITNDTCDKFIHEFLFSFTHINPDIDENLQEFNNAYTEIANFFASNPNAGNFQLTNYGNERVRQMVKINQASNEVLTAMKNDPCNVTSLYAAFAVHSSKTEMSEFGLLNELQNYVKIMRNNSAQVNFDPIQIFSINNAVQQNGGSFITEARAIRNLIDHHKFDLNARDNSCIIHFKSQVTPKWKFAYDREFTGDEFRDYLALLDLFYKCVVNILFCYQLLAVIRAHFVN